MREKLVTELVKEVLGPRNGLREELVGSSPLTEYITGVLAPEWMSGTAFTENPDVPSLNPAEPDTDEEDFSDLDVEAPPGVVPALDPANRPVSFGLSFTIRVRKQPGQADLCLSWARYYPAEVPGEGGKAERCWKRYPRVCVLTGVDLTTDPVRNIYLGVDQKNDERARELPAGSGGTEIRLHIRSLPLNEDRTLWQVQIHAVNAIPKADRSEGEQDDSRPPVEAFIFQPQIRVSMGSGVELHPAGTLRLSGTGPVQYGEENRVDEEAKLEFLYRERKVLARGFLCAAIWKDIDPEKAWGGVKPHGMPEDPPFHWPERELLDEEEKERFAGEHGPDVRTEFVPVYSVPFPDMREHEFPEFAAENLAELWDPGALAGALSPMIREYRKWIDEQKAKLETLPEEQKEIARKLLREGPENVLERMKLSFDLLLRDDDVRLAFLFANKALDLQARWRRKQGLKWRPFQMGYILTVLHSIANPVDPARNVCDLLWVPTGAGKTEAYLFLIAFTLALRRRRELKQGKSGAGVAVITRYTLRLLTIQQFRRLLSVITACEYLRVDGFLQNKPVGWRPSDCLITDDFLWGSTPFSAGLWVGGGVTPNRLGNTGRGGNYPGALEILQPGEDPSAHGEPAQVLNCPACGALLAVPRTENPGPFTLHLVVQTGDDIQRALQGFRPGTGGIQIGNLSFTRSGVDSGFGIISIRDIRSTGWNAEKAADRLWKDLRDYLTDRGFNVTLVPVRASRPGYFTRWYDTGGGREKGEYDFEIFCPSPECRLAQQPWAGGLPSGSVHATPPQSSSTPGGDHGLPRFPDGNRYVYVQEAFRHRGNSFVSLRIPIPAYTVDEQIYARLPSVVVATADKFARPAFEPRAAGLFGKVTHHNRTRYGFYHRERDGNHRYSVETGPLPPPELILQDELHLITGPLGSLVGLYETAVEYLCLDERGRKPKYIASTATVRSAGEQVKSVFARDILVFPPHGLDVDDRFFIRERFLHPLEDESPGRLYLGVCAPGTGALTPVVRIYARLLQSAGEMHSRHGNAADRFMTLVGYFNALRELGGTRALCRQDIPERLQQIGGPSAPRTLTEDRIEELSSRIDSTVLPSVLDRLASPWPDAPDVVLATSMFGTGVDIDRLALMVVNGQPKTTSAYIQASGRVGRQKGGLVVVFYRATRPRDLSHYEDFTGYHHRLHRFVEPVTVYPFAKGTLRRAAGPVCVFILRNSVPALAPNDRAAAICSMASVSHHVNALPDVFVDRAQQQPELRRPDPGDVRDFVKSELDRWKHVACQVSDLVYVEYSTARQNVVLGDLRHEYQRDRTVVFRNAPQSLRDIEETCTFE